MNLTVCGAQKKTRTSTSFRTQVPETCASTNSAIWAQKAPGFFSFLRHPGLVKRRLH